MDPLTQGLLGATAAQSIGAKKLSKDAWKVGFLAGMAPDLDILIRSPHNPMLFLQYHRQFTHSLFFIPFGGLVVGLFCLLVFKSLRSHKWLTLLISIFAYGTHGLLDTTTSYGTLLLWPFNHVRYAWDIMSIVDPIFTASLLGLLLLSIVRRSYIIAIISLFVSLSYISFGAIQHHRAFQAQTELATREGQIITKARVMPALGHLLSWRGVYLSGQNLYFTRIKIPLFAKPIVRQVMSKPSFTPELLPEKIKQSKTLYNNFNVFQWFTDDYMFLVSTSPLVICDGRYFLNYQPPTCMWGVEFPQYESKRKYVKFKRDITL